MYSNIPKELKEVQNWVCWNFEQRNGKTTKIPKNPHTGKNAQSNNNNTWSDFNTALQACSKYKHDGIGFMFTSPYFGVDLDKCIENKEFVEEFVNALDSYTEYSVSKNGIHIICKGNLPEGRRRKGIVEMYEKERFFVMTGDVYGNPREIKDCTESIKDLHKKYVHADKPKVERKEVSNVDLTADDILKIAFNARNGKEIEALYRGNFSSYPSQSEADLALCNHLAFYTHSDYNKMDMLFRSSGLMREKWNEMRGATTYGQKVLNEAIDNCKEHFKPREKQAITYDIQIDFDSLEYPFDDDVYRYVINIENEAEQEKARLKLEKIAEKSGRKEVTNFNKMYKIFAKEKPKSKEENNNVTNFGISNELYCGHWVADLSGIKTFGDRGETKASNSPVYPLKLLRNQQTREQKCKISYFDKYKWNELFVEKEMLMTSTKIVGLSKYGLLVTSDMAKHLTNYFAEVFQRNHFEEMPSTSKMGWGEKYKSFLPITPSEVELDAHISFSTLVESLIEYGDKEKYLGFIKTQLLHGKKEVKLAIYASLASVLLKPLNALSFIVHIYGQAGIGKTLLIKVCAGIWGKPIENGFLQDPKGTLTSFEVLLGLLNNLPFIADDINKLNQNNQFSTLRELTYFLCSGNGKPRSNPALGLREPQTWHNVSILNGEKALTADDAHGGELLRTIELQLEPFALFEDGSGTAEFLHNNYGFLGKMFIEWIIKYEQIEQAKNMKKDFANEIKRLYGNKKEGKQIESVGVLYATQDILCGMLGIERTLDIQDFASLIKNIDDVLDTQRAYEKICNILIQNSSSFLHKDLVLERGDKEPNVRWGWFNQDEYYIIPTQFAKICKEVNIDKRLFIEWAIDKNIIESEKNRNDGTKVCLIREQDKRIRVVKMTISKEEEDE